MALALAALAACSRYEVREEALAAEPCAAPDCVCEDETRCELDCQGDACELGCADVNVCDMSCGDDCQYECESSTDCSLLCADSCSATCDDGATCAVDCGEDCDVLCTEVAECRVAMRSGIATCRDVSQCVVDCLVSGELEPAIDCGGGVFACGACP